MVTAAGSRQRNRRRGSIPDPSTIWWLRTGRASNQRWRRGCETTIGRVMADLTTDSTDPRLGHGTDEGPTPQNDAYLILSKEERAKGFVRPVRRSYIHARGTAGLRACGVLTKMSTDLAETYARNPIFYGATYCVGCQRHLPVAQFDWEDGNVVGS